jgi:hypothetical protein
MVLPPFRAAGDYTTPQPPCQAGKNPRISRGLGDAFLVDVGSGFGYTVSHAGRFQRREAYDGNLLRL